MGEVFAPVPGCGVVAAADGIGCAYAFGDLVVETGDLLAGVEVGLAEAPCGVALGAHGAQVDRSVSPAAGVVDLGCGGSADGA
jgi:hypothetical protein